MDIVYSIIQNGDVFQTVGSLKYLPDGMPALSRANELCYNDTSFTVDLTPLLENGESSGTVLLKSSNKLVVFSLSMQRGKLEGIGMISVNDQVICEGIWNNGKRNGHFTEYCNGVVVFDGRYVDGVRTGLCYYRELLNNNKVNSIFIEDTPLLSEVHSFRDSLIRTTFTTSYRISSLEMINGYGEKDGIVVNYKDGELMNMELWNRNYCVYKLKCFQEEEMLCYNRCGMLLYEGGFSNSPKSWLLANRWGRQYENGALYYKGDFMNGQRSGMGALFYKNGNMKYEGYWFNDLPDGWGRLMDANGHFYMEVYCNAGNFTYGLRSYSVYDFAPSSRLLTFFFNSSSNTIYERINYPMYPSSHFDCQQAENKLFSICFSNHINLTKPSDFPLMARSQLETLQDQLDIPSLPNLTRLNIPGDTCCSSHFEVLLKLVDLVIADGCDSDDSLFTIESASKLETIQIGKNCYNDISDFSIVNCPRLRSLRINGDSFIKCSSFVLNSRVSFLMTCRLSSSGDCYCRGFDTMLLWKGS